MPASGLNRFSRFVETTAVVHDPLAPPEYRAEGMRRSLSIPPPVLREASPIVESLKSVLGDAR